MIPLKLYLTNFLSYRATTELDFSDIHLACISGLNGAGKSTILDGITWALFGKCRSKSDDDIVHRLAAGEGGMAEVRFEFALENNVYRIIRQKKPGRVTVLEFQLSTSDNKWKTLTEAKSRETQMEIEKVLRMNYDTFTNASFFLQGKADEFTTKTPGRRKEILADLLGVNVWEEHKTIVSERRKKEEAELSLLDSEIARIDSELAEQAQRQEALAAAQAQLAKASTQRSEKERLREQMQQVQILINQQKELVNSLKKSAQQATISLNQWQQEWQQLHQKRAGHQTLLDQSQAIIAAYTAWQAAETLFQSWQTRYEQFNALQQARQPHQLSLETARSRLQERQQALKEQGNKAQEMVGERQNTLQMVSQGQSNLEKLAEQLSEKSRQETAWHEARTELQRLDGERKLHQQELDHLQKQALQIANQRQAKVSVEVNANEAELAFNKLDQQLTEINQQREQYVLVRGDVDRLTDEQNNLRDKMKKLRERQSRLEGENGDRCPLCGQELTESHRQNVLDDLKAEGQQYGDQFRENKLQIEQLTANMVQLEQATKQSGRIERDRTAQERRLSQAQARLDEIERTLGDWEQSDKPGRIIALQIILANDTAFKASQNEVNRLANVVREKESLANQQRKTQEQVTKGEARLAEIERSLNEWRDKGQPELSTVQEQLAKNQFAPEAQAALAKLDQQIANLGYDGLLHSEARQQRERLKEAPGREQQLKQAQAAVEPLDNNLNTLAAQIAAQKENLADLTNQHDTAQAKLTQLTANSGDLITVAKELTALREEENEAQRRVGAAQQRLAVLDDLRRQREQLSQERAGQTLLIQRLKLLEKSCGRDGVQAMLIEHALPDIEENANELLDRLTGGEMRVNFDTQKGLKSRKELAETLDIQITDNVGERPYENFSGGEQFRVNFAVRLALSRILAKRAGARLQTLVIDEGFGSQDPAGRQRLIEAIHTIQDDFVRILVITHIDELRDAFPARIEVEKGPAGSRLIVSHA